MKLPPKRYTQLVLVDPDLMQTVTTVRWSWVPKACD
jgi:hypothetical protein